MKKVKKASVLAVLSFLLVFGFSQYLSANPPFNIGKCSDYLANPGYPFLYVCPDDFCSYTVSQFVCDDDEGNEVTIYYRNPDCDNYYCIYP